MFLLHSFVMRKKGEIHIMGKSLNGKELGKGITQRPNHAYMARFVDSQGKRRTLYDRNLKRLMLKLEKARYESEQGMYGTGEDVSLESWFESYLKLYKEGRVKITTYIEIVRLFPHAKKTLWGE